MSYSLHCVGCASYTVVNTLQSEPITLQSKHDNPEVKEDLRTVRESVKSEMSLGTPFPPHVFRNSVVTSLPNESGSPFPIGEFPN